MNSQNCKRCYINSRIRYFVYKSNVIHTVTRKPENCINALIHSRYFYSAFSSSPLLLTGAPDDSIDTVSELTCRSTTGNCERRTCPRSLYVVARVGFEPANLWTQGTKLTTEPPHLIYIIYIRVIHHAWE